MNWNDGNRPVSRAFDRWVQVEAQVRAFHRYGLLWSEAGYESLWSKAERRLADVFDPDVHYGDEHVEYFDDSISGMWPDQFEWMMHAATIKDAVTAFEVYLEKSLQEIVSRIYAQGSDGNRFRVGLFVNGKNESPMWSTLKGFHQLLGGEVDTPRVREIRAFRHLLTHQRGEIRTDEALEQYSANSLMSVENEEDLWSDNRPYVGGDVPLGRELVVGYLDDLAGVVRSTDPRVWEIAWGDKPWPDIGVLREKKYIKLYPA
ncbi:hypothetical protein [Amycolatopsis sp. WAC 04197]|uniref:hypothetical protein n=1 Tax=Amycolatopsis sp. WAC 04197 TaxID=2203199 RepID=UPI000F7B9CE7|nr:hypothetical protein [Amycolatopsis sp. WAC 04197]